MWPSESYDSSNQDYEGKCGKIIEQVWCYEERGNGRLIASRHEQFWVKHSKANDDGQGGGGKERELTFKTYKWLSSLLMHHDLLANAT